MPLTFLQTLAFALIGQSDALFPLDMEIQMNDEVVISEKDPVQLRTMSKLFGVEQSISG